MSFISATAFDPRFSDHNCYWKYDLEDYPICVRPTVERMRVFAQVLREKRAIVIDDTAPLGSGTYGQVYRGSYEPKLGKRVVCAIKIFTDGKLGSKECEYEASMLWKSAGNAYIVGMHGIFRPEGLGSPNALVLDLIEGPTLKDHILSFESEVFPQAELIELARQLLDFLFQIQMVGPNRQSPLIHGDLSLENIFWRDGNLKVIDCGIMSEMSRLSRGIVQKSVCRAPEVFLDQLSDDNKTHGEAIRYDEKVDMWSVGLVLFELLTKRSFVGQAKEGAPYGCHEISFLVNRLGMPADSFLKKMSQTGRFFQENLDGSFSVKSELLKKGNETKMEEQLQHLPEMLDLIKQILVWDPKFRLTPQEALKHLIFI